MDNLYEQQCRALALLSNTIGEMYPETASWTMTIQPAVVMVEDTFIGKKVETNGYELAVDNGFNEMIVTFYFEEKDTANRFAMGLHTMFGFDYPEEDEIWLQQFLVPGDIKELTDILRQSSEYNWTQEQAIKMIRYFAEGNASFGNIAEDLKYADEYPQYLEDLGVIKE
jgi:hypothetical protein